MTTSAYEFYTDPEYKRKQSEISKRNWKAGIYNDKIIPLIKKHCKNPNCRNVFFAKPNDRKTYCSQHCSAIINNPGRKMSELTKTKISNALKSLPNKRRGRHFSKPRVKMVCLNCNKSFELVPYLAKRQKYCSIHCNIVRLGRKTTSPKASKGKNGIRIDIDPTINFYSTWEANVARVYNLVDIKWIYAPKLFDLGEHTYRPDFYLTEQDIYLDPKNPYCMEKDKLKMFEIGKKVKILYGDIKTIKENLIRE